MVNVVNYSAHVSKKNLQDAEAVLQALADAFSRKQMAQDSPFAKEISALTVLLKQDRIEQREQSDQAVKRCRLYTNKLTDHYQDLCLELERELVSLTGKKGSEAMSVDEAMDWKQREEAALDGVLYDCDHQLAQFSSELDSFSLQLNRVQDELKELFEELRILTKENEKLKSPDRRLEIQSEIKDLENTIETLLQKAAEICRIPYAESFDLNKAIAEMEDELRLIESRIGQTNEVLVNHHCLPVSKAKKRKATELEVLVEQVKKAVHEKKSTLEQLIQVKKNLSRARQLEKTARLDLQGEESRVEKQNARNGHIRVVKVSLEDRKGDLSAIRENISDVEANIKAIRQTQQTVQKKQSWFAEMSERIRSLDGKIQLCRVKIEKEKADLVSVTPSSVIWFESIVFRITAIRKRIGFGNLFRVLFLPHSCYQRYLLGLQIRKDLIIAERALHQLGFISDDYLVQADIFNRNNKKGQLLCLDILCV